jgi:putative phosphoribosyl transferase
MTLPFVDRAQAGLALAHRLQERFPGQLHPPAHCIIVGLARGGIPVALSVAKSLSQPMDVLLVRKLGIPWQPELAFGALASGGFRHINDDMVTLSGLGSTPMADVINREAAELQRREQLYRSHLPGLDWQGAWLVLVDDGMATGASMQVAVDAALARNPAGLVVAVPVCSAEALSALQAKGQRVLSLHVPEPFGAVGQWYECFPQVNDIDVMACMDDVVQSVRSKPSAAPRWPMHP